MNTKFKNLNINSEFEDLFVFSSYEDKIKHNAEMISFRILSEIEKLCEERKIKKKDLAEKIHTSKSYITQLFRGTKQVNTSVMSKFEDALDITFEIRAKLNEETIDEFVSKQISSTFFNKKRRIPHSTCVMYCFPGQKSRDKTHEFMESINTENKLKQKAG